MSTNLTQLVFKVGLSYFVNGTSEQCPMSVLCAPDLSFLEL